MTSPPRPLPRRPARTRTLAVVGGLTLAAAAPPAAAQVLERRFDPTRNGPWTVIDLGTAGVDATTCDPRALADAGGAVHLLCKTPVEGPPTGGGVWRVDGDRALAVGGPLGDDPAAILAADGALWVAGKGSLGGQPARVLRLDGATWAPAHDGGLDAEVRGLALHDGELHVATKHDGVYRLAGGALARTGVTRTILPEGYVWAQLGDHAAELHEAALVPGGGLVVVGKDQRVRRWDGQAWADLGNLAEATWDAAGVPVTFVREPKAVAVGADGTIVVGTKGLAGAAEGRDRGAVWRWTGGAWERLGDAAMAKEARRVLVLEGGVILAGTNESGVWRWDGAAWTAVNDGLPVESGGKIKGERLALGDDGALYVASKNLVHRRPVTAAGAWTEVGFLAGGEEVTAVGTAGGALYVGCKVGTAGGAVYRQTADGWQQLGPDLARDVKQLVWSPSGELHAVLGGGTGALRWSGGVWIEILGALTGDAGDFKQLLLPTAADLYAVSKQGLQVGAFRREPLEVVEHALRNADVSGLAVAGGQLWAPTKVGGLFRRATDAATEDGVDWQRATAGLPEVELVGVTETGADVVVIGKRLLYRGRVGADGTLVVTPFGGNPGKAALDGDGALIFTGETDFTAVVEHRGRLFAGTKDGLFTSRDGRVWQLYNGPAEVKALALVGGVLHVAVKSRRVPDPVGAPTVEQHGAQVWTKDLELDPDVDEPPRASAGCAAGGAGGRGAGPLLLVAIVPMLWPLRRRGPGGPGGAATSATPPARPRAARWLSWSRRVHTWAGVSLGLVILMEGCTALFLLHKHDLPTLDQVEVPAWLLPGRYDGQVTRPRPVERVAVDLTAPARMLVASADGALVTADGGAAWTPLALPPGLDRIHAVAIGGDALWLGHGVGLTRCTLDGAACADVALDADRGRADRRARAVRSVAVVGARVVVVLHKGPALASDDGGARWRPLSLRRPTGQARAGGAPLGKVLADLHTGAFFGGAAWVVYDLAAVAMVLFVITGLHLWLAPLVIRRRKARVGARARVAA